MVNRDKSQSDSSGYTEALKSLNIQISIVNLIARFQGSGNVILTFDNYELTLYDVVYSSDFKLNIISTERLKRENYVGYSN